MKYNTFVAVIGKDNRLKWVTDVNHTTKTCYWDGKCAKPLPKYQAKQLQLHLMIAGYNAVLITVPTETGYTLQNSTLGDRL